MRWELQENDLEAQSVHNPVFHTTFTFKHERKPFFLKVEITGKLLRKGDRRKQNLRFPPERSKDQGEALTFVSLKDGLYDHRLDVIAKGLALAMQKSEADDMQAILVRRSQYSPFIIMFQLLANLLGIFGGTWPSDKSASALPEESIAEVVDDVVKNAPVKTAGQKHQTQQPKDTRVGRNR